MLTFLTFCSTNTNNASCTLKTVCNQHFTTTIDDRSLSRLSQLKLKIERLSAPLFVFMLANQQSRQAKTRNP